MSAKPSSPPGADTEEPFRFQIALSFPGGYRNRIDKIAWALAEVVGQKRVLYDNGTGRNLRGRTSTYIFEALP